LLLSLKIGKPLNNLSAVLTPNNKNTGLKVLLIFNKLSDFRNEIYDGFLLQIDGKASVDLYVHSISHHNSLHFAEVIYDKMNTYDYFAIMLHAPHLNEDILKTLNSIPKEKLLILDKQNEFIRGNYACVYQDFEADIYETLSKAKSLINKYKTLNFVIQEKYFHSLAIMEGVTHYAVENNLKYNIYTQVNDKIIRKNEAYLVLSERFLAEIIKHCEAQNLKIGLDIGILSYNETPIKEVLSGGITVVTTDHFQLGKTAADLILNGKKEHIRNPFLFIQRNSL
jgi:DNA-binding LacI/PurR family transcriptional regulator